MGVILNILNSDIQSEYKKEKVIYLVHKAEPNNWISFTFV